MRNLWRSTKGAVTVFVTLLLIPAILVTGTGVDLARLYAARSVTRDANQLAANAVLTNYDAVLQDLYGLYAIALSDDTLTEMVDTYVRASLFGEDISDAQLGEFRLFSGQEDVSSGLESSEPLRTESNVEVLRRQIEEYAKWRVPVAIVSDILDRLQGDEFDQVAADTQATTQMIAVNEKLQEVSELYRSVKNKADEIVSNYSASEDFAFSYIEEDLIDIKQQFADLLAVREEYESAFADGADQDELDLIIDHYDAIMENISSLASGGYVGTNWRVETDFITGEDIGSWTSENWVGGIEEDLEFSAQLLRSTESSLDELIELCRQADVAKDELRAQLDQLEAALDANNCSEQLDTNMRAEITNYRNLSNYDFRSLAQEMKRLDMAYIAQMAAIFEEIDRYGTVHNNLITSPSISFTEMSSLIHRHGYAIDLNGPLRDTIYHGARDELTEIQGVTSTSFTHDPNNFKSFAQCSSTHAECYSAISALGEFKSEGELTEEEREKRESVENLYTEFKQLWDGMTDYDVSPGAASYSKTDQSGGGFAVARTGPTLELGLGDFSGGMVNALNTMAGLVTGSRDIGSVFGSILNDAANRVLLVGYDTQMFSCWTTQSGAVSMSGQDITATNNYFYKSELEYLYNGNLNATNNLLAVTTTLLAIRFVANYASSYIIDEINAEIRGYEEAVSLIPFAGAVLRFLVRPMFVLAESVVDVARLRSGRSVVLLKTDMSQWSVSLINAIFSSLSDAADGSSEDEGLRYSDYLTIFLLAGDPNIIAHRTGDLIALNVTTKKHDIAENQEDSGTDERAEAISSVALFDLSKANTTFSFKTTTNVRFVFLSMPFAQAGINGVVPPRTFPVIETDYRGY